MDQRQRLLPALHSIPLECQQRMRHRRQSRRSCAGPRRPRRTPTRTQHRSKGACRSSSNRSPPKASRCAHACSSVGVLPAPARKSSSVTRSTFVPRMAGGCAPAGTKWPDPPRRMPRAGRGGADRACHKGCASLRRFFGPRVRRRQSGRPALQKGWGWRGGAGA